MRRSLIIDTHASSCYFRTSVEGDGRKALIQITERCNLHCAHCFVSSGDWGEHMSRNDIVDKVLPRLMQARVERVTLTGGEPFAHPDLLAICDDVVALGLPLGVCTNATLASDKEIAHLARSGAVHVNVSFDGFRPESHGKFRGSVSSFATTVATTRKFAAAGMLQGLLSTPNMLTEPGEFAGPVRVRGRGRRQVRADEPAVGVRARRQEPGEAGRRRCEDAGDHGGDRGIQIPGHRRGAHPLPQRRQAPRRLRRRQAHLRFR
jgi:hypothetical protein